MNLFQHSKYADWAILSWDIVLRICNLIGEEHFDPFLKFSNHCLPFFNAILLAKNYADSPCCSDIIDLRILKSDWQFNIFHNVRLNNLQTNFYVSWIYICLRKKISWYIDVCIWHNNSEIWLAESIFDSN